MSEGPNQSRWRDWASGWARPAGNGRQRAQTGDPGAVNGAGLPGPTPGRRSFTNNRRLVLVVAAAVLVFAGLNSHAGGNKHRQPAVSYDAAVSQFMCVSCHEPLAQVSSPQAISEKQQLRSFIDKRMTLPQIKTAMVSQYGKQVLARPPASGFGLSIYVVPPAVVALGLLLLGFMLPRWRRRARDAAETSPERAPPLAAEDTKRLNDDLADFI